MNCISYILALQFLSHSDVPLGKAFTSSILMHECLGVYGFKCLGNLVKLFKPSLSMFAKHLPSRFYKGRT